MAMAYYTAQNSKNDDSWKQRCMRQQIDDELNRRVRDALETPPLERLRRRQLQQQAKAAAAAKSSEVDDLNAHLDLTEKEREYLAARRRQQTRLKLQSRADSVPDLHHVTEGNFNRFMNERYGPDVDMDGEAGRVYTGEGYQQRPQHVQAAGYTNYEDWDFASAQRSQKPSYPDGTAPVIPHPKFKNIIHPEVEPLYTSIPVALGKVPGAKTFDNQVTQYTQKWRGICIVYDSEKSKRDQSYVEPPRNPLYAPHLIFESRFESGNLRQARRVGQFEYELVLKTDVFTKRHTQWFYFRVRNMVPGVIYKFRIVNLLKRDSLYNHGMRPLMYSEKDADINNRGWVRHGHHISYARNVQHTICPLLSRELAYYELEWQMEFPHESDTCYLAHCYPYTYTDLKDDLDNLLADPMRSQYVKREVLCETRVGNNCYLLTVTDFDCKEEKKHVVVSARVHPGESNSSWMLKGLVDFITGDSKEAMEIRRKFVYKIAPMLNPDGVIVGNYRCSLQARDLNRNYRHPRRDNFPTVFNVKRLVENLAESVGVFVYCDFHGHSRKPNVFMYGNNTSTKQEAGSVRAFLNERMLPFCISKLANGLFHYESCKFHIRRCKESTGRVVMYRAYDIKNSFTMEATFCGTQMDRNGSRHFNQLDFMNSGKYFAQGVVEYGRLLEDKQRETEVILDLTRVITQQIIAASKITTEDQSSAAVDIETVLHEHLNPGKATGKTAGDSNSSEDDRSQAYPTDQSAISDDKRATVIKALDSITEETIAKCVTLLEKLSLPADGDESESSDSDSESEPEMPEEKAKKKKKSKGKKKKDKKQGLPLINGDSDFKNGRMDGKGNRAHWSNPYSGRSNGGIPCFSEERSMERAAKRMAELQKRMEEKTARNNTFGPFSEREFFGDREAFTGVDSFYEDLEAQQKQAEEDYNRSMKTYNPHNFTREKNHMDFMKPNEPDLTLRKPTSTNLAPNTNQFEMTLKRSRTDMFEAGKYNRWQRSTASSTEQHKAPPIDTWSEAEARARMYPGSHSDMARNSSTERVITKRSSHSSNSSPCNDHPSQTTHTNKYSTDNSLPGAHIFEPSTNTNPLHMLTREYSELLASRLRASHARITTKSQTNRSNLLKALQVNPLHAQPGIE